MCGIVAALSPPDLPPCAALDRSIEDLAHRGPDQHGVTSVLLPWTRVTLGQARLTIVDQTHLTVPYYFAQAGVVLAFNGEIYNWKELRHELHDNARGLWDTSCDAEVIAWAWRVWGTECLHRFNGMWGLVLVDMLQGSVFVARDRAGKKPLYWAKRGGRLYFASEAKALPCELEETSCPDMEAFEFDFGESTPFLGVQRLPGGYSICLSGSADLERPPVTRWWQLPSGTEAAAPRSYMEGVEQLTSLIVSSVVLRSTAEVPVALQLSGGLDSAIILGAWKQVHAGNSTSLRKYCIDFAQYGIDNISAARTAAEDVALVSFDAGELAELIPRVVYHLDTPATWSAICLWKLAERIVADGHKIVLSGEGADELFGGYSRYRLLYWLERMRQDPLLEAYGPTMQHLLAGSPIDALARLLDRSEAGEGAARVTELILQHGSGGRAGLARTAMRVEWHTTMQVLLRMGDRMAAAWSLENRCPFLDYRIAEFAQTLPTEWLISKDESKHILRDVARALGVPSVIIEERTKKGLTIPWARWAEELGVETAGSRGSWNRSGFANMMRAAWRKRCLRSSACWICDQH